MVSSQQKTIGIVVAGAVLLFLLKGKAEAQTLAPSEEITPSLIPSLTSPEPSPALAPTKSILSIAPSNGGGGGWEDILTNPALRRIVSEILKIPERELTGQVLSQAGTASEAGAAGGAATVGLINLAMASQMGFTNPYSGYVSMIPIIGPVIGGFIEGILGSPLYGAGEEWIPEMLGRGEKVYRLARDLIKELQESAEQEPYKSLLANAQYNSQGWAIPSNWVAPSIEQYYRYYSQYGGLDYGASPLPTETIEDFTPWGAEAGVFSYSKDTPYLVDISSYRVGINLFSLLGLNPIFFEAVQAAAIPRRYTYYTDIDGVQQPPSAVMRPETIELLDKIFGWGTMLKNSQKSWAGENYSLPPYYPEGSMVPAFPGVGYKQYGLNPWDYEFMYPWNNPYLKAIASVPIVWVGDVSSLS